VEILKIRKAEILKGRRAAAKDIPATDTHGWNTDLKIRR
jgi:hypothetical protein